MFIDIHAYLVSKVIIYIILVRKLHKNPRHILKTHIYAEFNQMLMFFDYHTELILKNLNVFFYFICMYTKNTQLDFRKVNNACNKCNCREK